MIAKVPESDVVQHGAAEHDKSSSTELAASWARTSMSPASSVMDMWKAGSSASLAKVLHSTTALNTACLGYVLTKDVQMCR